ncbi:MAG: YceI family protein [Saprospiraceae bacterium]|nr:YceI family protein [Saprospiraceae bacterium]
MSKFLKLTFLFITVSMIAVSCKNKPAGDAAGVGEAGDVSQTTGTVYTTDATLAKIAWEGSKPGGKHNGIISISEGSLTVTEGVVSGGTFTIDMNSINVADLEGKYKEDLEAHLKGTANEGKTDFFNVTQFPTAKFEITKVTELAGDAEGNALVYGNLTLLDVTKEVNFKATVSVSEDQVTVNTPPFTINRTDWGIKYGSKSFFDDLKDKFIEDNIGLSISLTAQKPAM